MTIEGAAPRILSRELFAEQAFWTCGGEGRLILPRDVRTGRWIHPFWNVDETDPNVERAAVSGKGTVFTFTVNVRSYNPAVPVPYILALVQLAEQEDLRIATNIVNCSPERVAIGMPVRVLFERSEDFYVPLFEPDG